jgi:hypothetical protein
MRGLDNARFLRCEVQDLHQDLVVLHQASPVA